MLFLKPSFKVLKTFYNDPQKNLRLILSRELNKINDYNTRQTITRTVYDVVRKDRILEYLIQKISQRKIKKIQPDVLLLLKIGIHLLIFSESFPDHAVVNEVVNITKNNAKRFVNALLRNVTTNKTTIINELEHIKQLNITYSIPEILIKNLKLISPQWEENLDYLNQQPLFHIRVNRKNSSYAEAKQLLLDNKITFKELETFHSFEIKETYQVINKLLKKRQFYFQDTGSQFISIIASRLARQNVLDCCAAPGTKSVTLSLLNPELTIYANDINTKRVNLMKNFLDQYGFTRINPIVSDIKQISFKKNVDFIIVDAPCTSSGTLRKNPDLKIKIDSNLVIKNAQNQYGIMKSIISYFSHSDYILYSVCSFIKEETEDVMQHLYNNLSLEKRFKTVNLTYFLNASGFLYKTGNYGYYLLPSPSLHNDLFYISLLESH